MNRRSYLTATGVTLFAGCTSPFGSSTNSPPNSTVTGAATTSRDTRSTTTAPTTETTEPPQETETGTATVSNAAKVKVVGTKLLESKRQYGGTEAFAAVRVKNTGEARAEIVKADVRFFDVSGNVIASPQTRLNGLGAGETWLALLPSHHQMSEVNDLMADANVPDYGSTVKVSNIEFTSSSLTVNKESATVTATAKNTTSIDLSSLTVYAKYYLKKDPKQGEERVVLASERKRITDLPTGETWQFKIPYEGPSHRRIKAYELFARRPS